MTLPTLSGVGRLTEDPELRFTPNGKAVVKVRLAFNSRRKNPQTDQWEDGDVFFVDGTAWDREAENIAESLAKGHEVFVTGRMKTRQYEKDGQKRFATDLMIDAIGPTLKFATAKVDKNARDNNSGGGRNGGGDPWATAAPTPGGARTGGGNWDEEPPF
ncbi:single-stranded DNA-binding protein [Micromonospora chersina]|uniref:single-stranded DNA-binding protein n=1 Tax=Micromonospora chersina TaxID=47854 RepID=UPI00371B6649